MLIFIEHSYDVILETYAIIFHQLSFFTSLISVSLYIPVCPASCQNILYIGSGVIYQISMVVVVLHLLIYIFARTSAVLTVFYCKYIHRVLHRHVYATCYDSE